MYKYPLSALLGLLFGTSGLAQIQNSSFEEWTSASGYEDPVGWSTHNAIAIMIGSTPTCVRGTPGFDGASYMKVTTNNQLNGVVTSNLSIQGNPVALTGQWKYAVAPPDEGKIGVELFGTNPSTGQDELVGSGEVLIHGSLADWQGFSIPITYASPTLAESVAITVAASVNSGIAGSTVSVDALGFGPSPGGVDGSLALWLASDLSGVAPAANAPDWDDLSLVRNPVETIGTMTLQAADAAHNFHPYFTNFSSANHFKDVNCSLAAANTFKPTEVTLFAVARINSATNNGRIMGIDDVSPNAGDPGLSVFDASTRFSRTNTSAVTATQTLDATVGRSGDFSAYTSGNTRGVGMDGQYATATITAGGGITGDILQVGFGNLAPNGPLPGDLQEVVWYNGALSTTQRQQVESYLSIKHGITYGGANNTAAFNYRSSLNDIIWNRTANAAFSNDITCIGRDDRSALVQKQSRSINGTSAVTLSAGTIAVSNTANTGTFDRNLSFLACGHDGQAQSTVVGDAACFTQLPAGVMARMKRVWKIQLTNYVQNTLVGFEQSMLAGYLPISNLRLLMDDDGVNWTNATVITGAVSASGRVVFSGVSFSNASPYFTLATINYTNTPLPVELLRFTGEQQGPLNLLEWTTASELNNDHFEVQRSDDANEFIRIGAVSGSGNSQSLLHYTFKDDTPFAGLNYYRLRQVDHDGASELSNVVVVDRSLVEEDCLTRTLDQEGSYELLCPEGRTTSMEVLDILGRPVLSIPIIAGRPMHIDLRTQPPGVYLLRPREGRYGPYLRLVRP